MKTLITNPKILQIHPQISSPLIFFHNPFFPNRNPIFFRKWVHHPKTKTLCSATSSESLGFNGWDDPRLGVGSAHPAESTHFQNLLNSLGIDQKRYIFVYLLGFICALSVSKIRVSSIIVFPACAIVFAVGFSIGFVNGGHFDELALLGGNKRSNLEHFKSNIEKLGDLGDFFDGFVSKISSLKVDIRRKIESKKITVDDLGNYVEVIDSIGLSSLNGKSVVQRCIDSMSIENMEMENLSSQKSSKKTKGVGESGNYFFKFIGSLFRETSVDPKAGKIKEGNKKGLTNLEANAQSRGNILGPRFEEKVILGNESEFSESNHYDPNENKFSDVGRSDQRDFQGERNRYQGDKVRFVNSKRINVKMGPYNEVETWASSDNFLDSMDFCVDSNKMETETFEKQEQMFGRINGIHWPRNSFDDREKEAHRPNSKEERISFDNDLDIANYRNESTTDKGSFPSSSVSNDIVFNEYLMKANALLKQAREYLRVKSDEKNIETLLCDAAGLFSKAIEMKPMSLLGVGQLGNTYLLHGELKLKRSRRLRAILIESDEISSKKRGKILEGNNDIFERRDRIASMLVRVCEECEELLVKAGKQYRLALSIDGNDMRAMYNWGLVLSFRAQLIADIGPEAAFDADKVFLAAIDKFDAMMSKSNVYAPDALFRWGVALQQRSRLDPRNKNQKVKLLQQAKRLYEDALNMDSDNMQVREALGSCISELDFRNY